MPILRQQFARPGLSPSFLYDFDVVELRVQRNGRYHFQSNNTIRLCGYLYKNSFNPRNSSLNLINSYANDLGVYVFAFIQELESNETYILVVSSSFYGSQSRSYSIMAVGPSMISFQSINFSSPSTSKYFKYKNILNTDF